MWKKADLHKFHGAGGGSVEVPSWVPSWIGKGLDLHSTVKSIMLSLLSCEYCDCRSVLAHGVSAGS